MTIGRHFTFHVRRAIVATSAAAIAPAFAAGGPENVLVVVNADSWASVAVANSYIAERGIPQTNIVYLNDIPSFERVGVEVFREKILQPAVIAAEKRGIARQVDYVFYSADFPTAIDVSADTAGKQFPKVITQPASITGLTFFYQFTLSKNSAYLGMNGNFYFRQRAQAAASAPWPEDEMKQYQTATRTLQDFGAKAEQQRLLREKEEAAAKSAGRVPFIELPDATTGTKELAAMRLALSTLLDLKQKHPEHTELLYNLACLRALIGEPDAAVEHLREAVEHGWWDIGHAQRDVDLRSLQGRADFKLLGARVKDIAFDLWPTSGFRSSVGWMPTGQPTQPEKGLRYLLPVVLAHTSGLGLSVAESIANLHRSIGADGSRPGGTVYFMENTDVRSTTREWGNARAAEKLKSIGIAASVEQGVLPVGKKDVAGALVGAATFDWAKSGSTILPGAICEHLTSFGGALNEDSGQTPLTAFLRAGAAGASGTVTEPYAVQPKFPTPFLHWHYAQGCTLAEAFYQSVAAPYQLLIVGDGLCAPWKRRILPNAAELSANMVVKGELSLTPTAESSDGIAIGVFELSLDGRRVAAAKLGDPLVFNTTLAPDGPHQLVLTAIGNDALASNGRLVVPIVVKNRESEIRLTGPSGDWEWDKPLEFQISAPGANGVALVHNLRPIASAPGSGGKVSIDPKVLGQGPVRIIAAAVYPDKKEAWAITDIRIIPPKLIPASALASGQTLQPGVRVTPAGLPGTAVENTTGDWLTKAGVARDGEFSVDGWFTVERDDTYQFQLQGPEKLSITVDGKPLDWPRGKEWWFVPAALAKGLHHVRIEGKASGEPKLDVRFGNEGTRRMNGTTFRHAKAG